MDKVIVKGHTYKPAKGVNGKWVVPGCECGQTLLGWAVNAKTARSIHLEHKKAILRDRVG